MTLHDDVAYMSMSSIILMILWNIWRKWYNSILILHLRLQNKGVHRSPHLSFHKHCWPSSGKCISWRWLGWMCSLHLIRRISSETRLQIPRMHAWPSSQSSYSMDHPTHVGCGWKHHRLSCTCSTWGWLARRMLGGLLPLLLVRGAPHHRVGPCICQLFPWRRGLIHCSHLATSRWFGCIN
jgi:ABC-type nickel/cobalt efflux system permease component RcnA